MYDGKEALNVRSKRIKVSPIETRNKGVSCAGGKRRLATLTSLLSQAIKKQLMRAIETRGMSREHAAFKEMYAIVNKGSGFALVRQSYSWDRDRLADARRTSAITSPRSSWILPRSTA